MGNKQEMLRRIREALGPAAGAVTAREARATTPIPQPPAGYGAAELEAQFCTELEKIGGRYKTVESDSQAFTHLESLLPSDPAARIAISDGLAARLPELRGSLAAKGYSLLPSLKEFSTAEKGDDVSVTGSLMDRYKDALFGTAAGLTTADYAIADTGTLVLLSKQQPAKPGPSENVEQHRLISLVPPVHICLLDRDRIVPNLATLISTVRPLYQTEQKPLAMTFISGPSRTADIELTLTMGVHGPKELHVLLVQNNEK